MKDIVVCPNCASKNISPKYKVPDRHYGIEGEFSLSECKNCTLIMLNPMPNHQELMSFYPENSYYSYHMDYEKKESQLIKNFKKILFSKSSLEYIKNKKPGNILDLGSGNGWIIYQLRKIGWNVKGVEPSKQGAETAQKIGKLDVFHGFLEDANYPSDYFDMIRSNHSFEHIPNPKETLAELYRILKPGGELIIGVPNINSITYKIFKKYWYFLGAPVHTFNYSDKTLIELGEKNRFQFKKILYNSREIGINGSIQIYLNRNKNKLSNQGFFVNNKVVYILGSMLSFLFNFIKKGDAIEVIFVKK